MKAAAGSTGQRGSFAMGLVVGLLAGLALALAVALYITKAPMPFVDKVPQRTAAQDQAEAERNRNWDPNAALGGRAAARAASAASGAATGGPATPASGPLPTATPPAATPAPAKPAAAASAARDPAAILSGAPVAPSTAAAPDAFVYFVQAGAFARPEDAEQQRARLAMLGLAAKVTEREQAGRMMYRVRVGPYPVRQQADELQGKLQEQGIEAQIVRVEKP